MVMVRGAAMNGLPVSADEERLDEAPDGVQRDAKQAVVVAEPAAPVRVQASERALGHAAD